MVQNWVLQICRKKDGKKNCSWYFAQELGQISCIYWNKCAHRVHDAQPWSHFSWFTYHPFSHLTFELLENENMQADVKLSSDWETLHVLVYPDVSSCLNWCCCERKCFGSVWQWRTLNMVCMCIPCFSVHIWVVHPSSPFSWMLHVRGEHLVAEVVAVCFNISEVL